MKSLYDEFRSFAACAEYTHWDSVYNSRISYNRNRKAMILNELKSNMHYGLIDKYLFPDYDKYEQAVSVFMKDKCRNPHNDSLFVLQNILKTQECPQGGTYHIMTLRFPKDIFRSIDNTFIKSFDYTLKCIVIDNWKAYFWRNSEFDYDRKMSLDSLHDGVYDVFRGHSTIVVSSTVSYIGDFALTHIIDNVMLAVMTAYMDSGLRWSSETLGKQKYVHNIDRLLLESDDMCKVKIGRLLKGIQKVRNSLNDPETFVGHDDITDVFIRLFHPDFDCPENEIGYYYSNCLEKTHGYRQMAELDRQLNEIGTMLHENDGKELCDVWNRCSSNKVTDKTELLQQLESKCQFIYNYGLTLLMHSMMMRMSGSDLLGINRYQ